MYKHRKKEILVIRKVMNEFCKKLEMQVKEHPHDFFCEEDVRCSSWLILYRLLGKKLYRKTNKEEEIRLAANFDPQLISRDYTNKNILDREYDLAILGERGSTQRGDIYPLCVIEFKFRRQYTYKGKTFQHGAKFHDFTVDYTKLKNKDDITPIKYGILVHIDMPPSEEREEIKRYVEDNSGKNNVALRYFYNEPG